MSKLVNLGSLCIDNVYSVSTLAGAGETVASRAHEVFPGGKGLNQSLAACRAGCDVVHVGCVGADGQWLKALLHDAGVDVENVREVDGASGHAVIQVDDNGQNSIVISGGTNRQITDADISAALSRIGPGDWLLLQNEINDLETVLQQAYARDVAVALNVAPVDGREQNYSLADLAMLIVNEVEAAALAGDSDPDTALSVLCEKYPTVRVVLTLGRDGLRYGHGDDRRTLAALQVDAVDETAAGDAFIGFLMAAVIDGQDIDAALRLASAAGALAVTRAGAASSIPTLAEVTALIDSA